MNYREGGMQYYDFTRSEDNFGIWVQIVFSMFTIPIYLLRNCGPINPISVRLEGRTEDTASGT